MGPSTVRRGTCVCLPTRPTRACARPMLAGGSNEQYRVMVAGYTLSCVLGGMTFAACRVARSLASMVINHYKLRQEVQAYHLGGMGCSNGTIAINLVRDMLKVRSCRAGVLLCMVHAQMRPPAHALALVAGCATRLTPQHVFYAPGASVGPREHRRLGPTATCCSCAPRW